MGMSVIALLVCLIVGLLLVRRGWRGRVVDDHPVCRQCGYDLVGHEQDQRQACPECGADLTAHGAVVMGNRVRQPVMVGIGALLLAVSLLVGVLGVGGLSSAAWQRWKPVAMLRMEARWSPQADAPLDELLRRLQAGTLNKGQINKIADDALAVQGDTSIPWQPKWGDFVEQAHAAGSLALAKWQQYGHQTIRDILQLELRPRVRLGDPVAYRMIEGPMRVGTQGKLWLESKGKLVEVASQQERFSHGYGRSLSAQHSGWSSGSVRLSQATRDSLTPGRCKVVFHFQMTLYDRYQGSMICQDDVVREGEFDLLPADQPTVQAVVDEAQSRAVRDALSLQRMRVDAGSQQGQLRMDAAIEVESRPVNIAFDVFMRDRATGREWEISSMCVVAGRKTSYGLGGGGLKDFVAQRVDLILRPSAEVAARSVDVFDYWGQEIIFEDVEVDWSSVPAVQQPVQSPP